MTPTPPRAWDSPRVWGRHTGVSPTLGKADLGHRPVRGPGIGWGIWSGNAGDPHAVPRECSRRLGILPCCVCKDTAGGDQNGVSKWQSQGTDPDGLRAAPNRMWLKTSGQFGVSVLKLCSLTRPLNFINLGQENRLSCHHPSRPGSTGGLFCCQESEVVRWAFPRLLGAFIYIFQLYGAIIHVPCSLPISLFFSVFTELCDPHCNQF